MFVINVLKYISDMSLFGAVFLFTCRVFSVPMIYAYGAWGLVCLVYLFMTIAQRKKVIIRSTQVAILKVSIVISIVAIFFSLFQNKGFELTKYFFPEMFASLGCNILLTRTLRHDVNVYTAPQFQALNFGSLAVVIAISAFLSSDLIAGNIFKGLKWFYEQFVYPVLVYILSCIAIVLGKFFIFVKSWFDSHRNYAKDPYWMVFEKSAAREEGSENYIKLENHALLQIIVGVVVTALTCFIIYKLLKKMSSGRKEAENKGIAITRSYSRDDGISIIADVLGNNPADRVRAKYRKFLEDQRRRSHKIEKKTTSETIMKETQRDFRNMEPVKAAADLRNAYIKARYLGEADKEDLRIADQSIKTMNKEYKKQNR